MKHIAFEMTWCDYLTPCPFRNKTNDAAGIMVGDHDCSICKYCKKQDYVKHVVHCSHPPKPEQERTIKVYKVVRGKNAEIGIELKWSTTKTASIGDIAKSVIEFVNRNNEPCIGYAYTMTTKTTKYLLTRCVKRSKDKTTKHPLSAGWHISSKEACQINKALRTYEDN